MTTWIFLSPHLDDAVFSCGGWISDLTRRGERVAIWTVFAGDPPPGPLSAFAQSLHVRWDLGPAPVALRRHEDEAACRAVGADWRHFDLPDCIYRRSASTGEPLYEGEVALFSQPVREELEVLVPQLAGEWEENLPPDARVLAPLSVGGHVDHRLVRAAAGRLARPVSFYADVPYVFAWASMVPDLAPEGAVEEKHPVSEPGLDAWMRANAAYASQLSTFWGSEQEMRVRFREYLVSSGGIRIWGVTEA